MEILIGNKDNASKPTNKPMSLKELTAAIEELQNSLQNTIETVNNNNTQINDINQQINVIVEKPNDEMFNLNIRNFNYEHLLETNVVSVRISNSKQHEDEPSMAEELFNITNNLLNNNLSLGLDTGDEIVGINMTKTADKHFVFNEVIKNIIHGKTINVPVYKGVTYLAYNANNNDPTHLLLASIDININEENFSDFEEAVDFNNDTRVNVVDLSTLIGYFENDEMNEDHKNNVKNFHETFLKNYIVFTYTCLPINITHSQAPESTTRPDN